MTKTREEYEDFNRALDIHFNRWDFKSKKELKVLMTNAGFRRKKEKSGVINPSYPVSQKQINYAWKHYQKRLVQQELSTTARLYVIEKYGNRTKINHYYKGKLYKRGQFTPKRRKQK